MIPIKSKPIKEFLLVSAILLSLIVVFFGHNFGANKTMVPLDIVQEFDLLANQGTVAKNYLLSDIVLQFFPNLEFQLEQFSQKSFPFWNPYQLGGVPFFADSQTSVFEITKLLAYIFDITASNFFLFSALMTLYLLGIFSYYFFRSLEINFLGAIFGTVAVMFCGPVIVWLNYPLTSAFIYLPLILLLINLVIIKHRHTVLPWIPVAMAGQLFAGQPQMSLLIFIVAVAWALFLLIFSKQIRFSLVKLWLIFFVLGILLASVQLGPSYDVLKNSESFQTGRGHLAQENIFLVAQDQINSPVRSTYDFFSRIWIFGITAFYPDYYGNPLEKNYRSPDGNWYNNYSEMSNYSGLLVILLALFSWFYISDKFIRFWLTIATLSFGIFAHLPFFNLLSYLPLINKINVGRFRFIFVFSCIILAVLVIQKLMPKIKVNKIRIATGILMVLVLFFDLYIYLNHYHQSVVSVNQAITNPVIAFLEENLGHQRYVSIGLVNSGFKTFNIPNASTVQALRDIRGYNQMLSQDFLNLANTYASRRGSWVLQDAIFDKKYFDAMAVKYFICDSAGCLTDQPEAIGQEVFSNGKVKIFASPDAPDRAYLVAKVIYASDQTKALEIFKTHDFNPATQAVVVANQDSVSLDNVGIGKVDFVQDDPGKIKLAVETSAPMSLVLSENYDAGWQAVVNNTKVKIYQTNGTFMSIIVPAGSSNISFVYRPPYFILYTILSLLSFLIIIASFWWLPKLINRGLSKKSS